MQVIVIPKNPQYGIIVEDPGKIHTSIYYEVYKNASRSVRDIIESNTRDIKIYPQEHFINTAIAFTGERGTGKSSAMLTFANLLKKTEDVKWRTSARESSGDREDREDVKFKDSVWEPVKQQSYFVLKTIDSTQMGEKERLIGALSAKMYQEYRSRSENGKFSTKVTTDDRRHFLELAAKVNRLAYMYCSGDWFKAENNIIQDLTEIETLRDTMHELIQSFLKLVSPNTDSDHTYLVVSIDDLDMNLSNSYEIVDEIRKFLTIKNVIILTSVCIPQLKDVVAKNFQVTRKDKSDDKETNILLAQRYIEKIFPVSRQHAMPMLTVDQLKQYFIGNLLGGSDTESATTRAELGLADIGKEKYVTVTDGVLHLIYRKTMLLLVPEECGRHWLIPNNMRQLCNFIHLLQGMEDVAMVYDSEKKVWRFRADDEFDENTWDALDTNLHRLMKYIADGMLDFDETHMSDEAIGMAKVLVRLIRDMPEWTLKTVNKKIVRDILTYVDGRSENSVYRQLLKREHYGPILEASRFPSMISMGDVMYVLGLLSGRSNDYTIKRLVEYVRVIWSIKMTREFYCVGVRRKTVYNGGLYITEDFRKAIGAMMVNPDCREFIAYNKEDVRSAMQSGNEMTRNTFDKTDWIWSTDKNVRDGDKEVLGSITVKSTLLRKGEPGNNGKQDSIRSDWREIEKLYVMRRGRYDVYVNYLSLFTNVLSPATISNSIYIGPSKRIEELTTKWQKANIMVFPFYSMDWINRFYSLLKQACNNTETVADRVGEGIKNFNEAIELVVYNSSRNMPDEQIRYIPRNFTNIPDALKMYIPNQTEKTEKSFIYVDMNFHERFKSLCIDDNSLGIEAASAIEVLLNPYSGNRSMKIGNRIKKIVDRELRIFQENLSDEISPQNYLANRLNIIINEINDILDENPTEETAARKDLLARFVPAYLNTNPNYAADAYKSVLKQIKEFTANW